jgi:hypothetical protein
MVGPQMDNSINIEQVFNDHEEAGDRETRSLVAEFVRHLFVANCEAIYTCNVSLGIFSEITRECVSEVDAFYSTFFKSAIYMGPVRGSQFEQLSLIQMPCHPNGPKNASTNVADDRKPAMRDPRDRAAILASLENVDCGAPYVPRPPENNENNNRQHNNNFMAGARFGQQFRGYPSPIPHSNMSAPSLENSLLGTAWLPYPSPGSARGQTSRQTRGSGSSHDPYELSEDESRASVERFAGQQVKGEVKTEQVDSTLRMSSSETLAASETPGRRRCRDVQQNTTRSVRRRQDDDASESPESPKSAWIWQTRKPRK